MTFVQFRGSNPPKIQLHKVNNYLYTILNRDNTRIKYAKVASTINIFHIFNFIGQTGVIIQYMYFKRKPKRSVSHDSNLNANGVKLREVGNARAYKRS